MTIDLGGIDPAMLGMAFMLGIGWIVFSAMTSTATAGAKNSDNSSETGKLILMFAALVAIMVFAGGGQTYHVQSPIGAGTAPAAQYAPAPVQPLFPEDGS